MRLASLVAASAALALAACSPVKVVPGGATAEAKPKGCAIEFLRERPSRAYDELGDLEAHLTSPPPGNQPAEALHDEACRLGADAVIVTRSFVTNEFGHMIVAGTAIRWTEAPTPQPEAAPAPDAAPAKPDGGTNL